MENALKVVSVQLAMIQWTTFTGSVGISLISQCHKADDHFTHVSQMFFGPKIAINGDGQGLGCKRLENHRQIQVWVHKQPAANDHHPRCHSSLEILRTPAFCSRSSWRIYDHRHGFCQQRLRLCANKSHGSDPWNLNNFSTTFSAKTKFWWMHGQWKSFIRACRKLDSIE